MTPLDASAPRSESVSGVSSDPGDCHLLPLGQIPTAEEVSGDFPGLKPTLQDHQVLPSESSHTVRDKGNKTHGHSDLKPKCSIDAPGHRKGYGRKNATIICHRY